ncbi:MAG: FAD-binding oxidoreductase [Paracoccaceae bacterium]|nr:FAD-binding oxidoreductase [Paracoccaceae bacterium]
MPDARADVAIVGGGITGLSAALRLADSGVDVAVFDAGRNAGSDANAGSLHVQLQSRFLRLFPDQAPNVEASLPAYLEAVRVWQRLDQRLGGVDLVRKGGLMLAETAEQLDFLEHKAEREAKHGLDVEILDRDAVERIAPWLGPQVFGAEICRDEGKLNPLVANKALRKTVLGLGVRIEPAEVLAVRASGAGVVLTHEGGTSEFDQVILAASWGTARLAVPLGGRVPVAWEPLHMNITEQAEYVIEHLIQHAERPITLKQFRSGQIVIGGGWEARFDPDVGTPEVVESSMIGNVSLAARIAPGIRNLRVIRTWAGLNTTADGKSIIGPLEPHRNVFIAVPGDAGYTLGPLIGQMAADMVLGETPEMDPSPYAPSRFL